MSTSFAAVPLVLGRRSLTSASSVLVAAAFFACATLFLTVAAGTWMFFQTPPIARTSARHARAASGRAVYVRNFSRDGTI
ncbi:hypothetical protein [Brevibacterium permense]|uniref:hypothetical protein n=1 Tax=Brevibacterium permense TaxID=234834 RepID=UPI001FDA6524|nr:hypothetical protein [Brevibacterium permense]